MVLVTVNVIYSNGTVLYCTHILIKIDNDARTEGVPVLVGDQHKRDQHSLSITAVESQGE